jgi:hypothetical protein
MRSICDLQPWYEEIDCHIMANIAYQVVNNIPGPFGEPALGD